MLQSDWLSYSYTISGDRSSPEVISPPGSFATNQLATKQSPRHQAPRLLAGELVGGKTYWWRDDWIRYQPLECNWPPVVLEMRCLYSFSDVLEEILDVNG